ncbi:hypothetical protein B0H14DRAFT_3430874 [Mycena olivaceomarginata]|nr:hypothetical protein B0H14DRAFT_3430874 [Mycena olivaceomarginata]
MPIITIFGATGTQGACISFLLVGPGLIANVAQGLRVDTDASKTLKAGGVEVVVGSLFDKESLKKAIQGSEVVFGGKNLVDAAKEVDVKFFIGGVIATSRIDFIAKAVSSPSPM